MAISTHHLQLLFLILCFTLVYAKNSSLCQSQKCSPSNQLHSYKYTSHQTQFLKRQSWKGYLVSGANGGTGPNGSLPQRLEIRELQDDTDMFTLYVLGLDWMQHMNQKDQFSWYQIGGIHGRPYVPWDNVSATAGNAQTGYCSHNSVLFAPWHRPYLGLFEQILYDIIQVIATFWPAGYDQDKYVATAANFRIPYWDWAAALPDGETILPDSVGGSASLFVDGPDGMQEIANPLFSYRFSPLSSTDFPDYPFSHWSHTLRHPNSSSATAVSQNDVVTQQLTINAQSFKSRLYNLFVNYPDYTTFSNEAWITGNTNKDYDSIESIHDQVHILVGDSGHMAYIDYAAFDPIFMLHHAMIDRCFALWQVLYPDSYVMPSAAKNPSFTTAQGQIQNATTNLTPFHNDTAGNFWTSDGARYTEAFNYVYKETSKASGFSTTELQANVRVAINNLYGGNSAISTALKPNVSRKRSRDVSGYQEKNTTVSNTYREWIANIRVKKHVLSGPFFIHIFLGPFNVSSPLTWPSSSNLVGTHCIFVRSTSSSSPWEQDQEVTATMPLTASLKELISSTHYEANADPPAVEAFLRQNLSYRISMLDHTAVPNELLLEGLQIKVVSSLVRRARGVTEFPIWGPVVEHFEIDGGL